MYQQRSRNARQLGAIFFVVSLAAAMSVSAGFKDTFKKATKSAESAMMEAVETVKPNPHNTISMDDALDQQADIGRSVTNALMYLSEAQFLMAQAVGLKEEAAIAQQNAEDLAAGEVTGEGDLDQRLSSSSELTAAISAKMNSGIQLDADGKEQFRASLPPYTMGTTTMIFSAKMAAASASSIMSSGDPAVIRRLAELKYLIVFGKSAPDLVKTFRGANQTIRAFANANDIDTSELDAETDGWD